MDGLTKDITKRKRLAGHSTIIQPFHCIDWAKNAEELSGPAGQRKSKNMLGKSIGSVLPGYSWDEYIYMIYQKSPFL